MTDIASDPAAGDARSQPPLKWGILGAARIARKAFADAIKASGGELVAIGASTLERAEAFARDFGIPFAADSYQAVLAHPEVEAVYLPLANSRHFQWALECARAGKHCLCEKPLVLSADEARQLREAFEAAGVRLVEGFMWRHLPSTAWIERQIHAGALGDLRRIHVSFSFTLDRPDDYRWHGDQGGGAFWDLGCYCVNAMRHFYADEPLLVSARSRWAAPDSRADHSTVGWLDFGEDRLATFECSFTTAYSQTLSLVGTRGVLRVNRPFSGLSVRASAVLESDGQSSEHDFEPDNAYERLARHFTRAARDPGFALFPAEDGLAQALAMDALAQSAAQDGAPRLVPAY